ncbi:MAG: hypothetical protein FJ295_13405 [Planctomycetes bacterium]|nr:hypothetical protein [Planctomycetota bacterium]
MPVSMQSWDDKLREGINLANRGERLAATQILLECLQSDPGDPEFAGAFLDHLAIDGSSLLEKSSGDQTALFTALAECNYRYLLRWGPRFLVNHPQDVPILRGLAAACAEQGDVEAEIVYLDTAFRHPPVNPTLIRQRADTLERLHRYDEALQARLAVEEANPEDAESAERIVRLCILRGRQQFGMLEDQESVDRAAVERRQRRPARGGIRPRIVARPPVVDPVAIGPAKSVPGTHVQLTPVQRLQALAREFPANVDYQLQLAMLYLEKGRDYDAEQHLAKARNDTDADPRIVALQEDVTMLRLSRKIEIAREQLASENPGSGTPTPEGESPAVGELKELLERRERFELQVFQQRAERSPHDLRLRLEWACRLRRAGHRREAVQRLEELLSDPALRPSSALEIAECSVDSDDARRAFRYFRMAINAAVLPEHWPVKKQALRRLAELATRFRMRELALRCWQRLLSVEPDDVEARHAMETTT